MNEAQTSFVLWNRVVSVFDRKILFFFVLRAVVCDRNCFDFGGLRGMNESSGVEYGISWGVAGGRPGCVREIGRGKRGKGRE